MVIVYLGIGVFLFVDDTAEELFQLSHKGRIILAGLIFGYGVLKIVRLVQKKIQISEENENN